MPAMRISRDGMLTLLAGLTTLWLGSGQLGCGKTEPKPAASAWGQEESSPSNDAPSTSADPANDAAEVAASEATSTAPDASDVPRPPTTPPSTLTLSENSGTPAPDATPDAAADAAAEPASGETPPSEASVSDAPAAEPTAPEPPAAAPPPTEPVADASPPEPGPVTEPETVTNPAPVAEPATVTESEPEAETEPPVEPAPVATAAAVENEPSAQPPPPEPFRLETFLEPKLAEGPLVALAAFRQWVEERLQAIEAIPSYTADFYKQERLDGELGELMHMSIKVAHGPFRVYVRHLEPERLNGQEAIFIEGQNNGRLTGHGVGLKKILGTLKLKPDSMLAMEGNKYPITHIGILHMARKTCERIDTELSVGTPQVTVRFGQQVDGRSCTSVELRRANVVANDDFAFDRRYFDDEYLVPTRYEQFGWSAEPGSEAPLLEFYEYRNLRLGAELPANAFDIKNPDYNF